jgi:hypothetical protein
MKTLIRALAIVIATCLLSTPVFAIPYCSSTEQVNCAKYGIGGKDCHQTDSEGRTQCIDVSEKGMEIIQHMGDQDRGGDEYRDRRHEYQDRCPQGYQQSEQKCSNEERRHGCKDIRLNSGIGCVRR